MKNKSCLSGRLDTKAFTLIELLVVVLIIGILAAVALPQYQKAVWKSKNTQLKTLIKNVRQAEDTYRLANGEYAVNFDELSLELPLTPSTTTTCGPAIAGTDSVRKGKDFEIILNAHSSASVHVLGLWTQGKYKCYGFAMLPNGDYYCTEKNSTGGSFCEKLERATENDFNGGAFTMYTMP